MPASVEPRIISSPSPLPFSLMDSDGEPARSQIQVARVGDFVSSRYGKFSITKVDLAQMVKNFREGKASELPVDYDHLGTDPKRPGDGIAAGWLKSLELAADGTKLLGTVEWTPEGGRRIRNKEYKYISPSFTKNTIDRESGENVGTVLLACAVTNFPFLTGMQALTLYSFSVMGDLALADAVPGSTTERALHLGEIDQIVSFSDDPELTPELTADERALSVRIKAVLGEGDDQVVRVVTADGEEFGWFHVRQLAPASSSMKEKTMSKINASEEPVNNPYNLRRDDLKMPFHVYVAQVAREKGVDLSRAINMVSTTFPAWAEAVERGEAV